MNLYEKIFQKLAKEFGQKDAEIKLIDTKGDGYHFEVKIISPQFEGKNRVQRSQLVHKILAEYLKSGEIHAITMTLKTPAEIEKL